MSDLVANLLTLGRAALAQVVSPDTAPDATPPSDPAAGVVTDAATAAATAAAPPAAATVPTVDPGAVALADPGSSFDFMHFLAQSDLVGKGLFIILVVMSLTSWYLILFKAVTNARTRSRANRYLQRFWDASSLEQVERDIATKPAPSASRST